MRLFSGRRPGLSVLVLTVLCATLSASAHAQVSSAPRSQPGRTSKSFDSTGVGDTSMFAPLELPPGNIYRSGAGAPGPRYWQQRADYDLRGTLDTTGKSLSGELTLRY